MGDDCPSINRRTFLKTGTLAVAGASTLDSTTPQAGERLYNGIELASPFPPQRTVSIDPMPVPYLTTPPATAAPARTTFAATDDGRWSAGRK